MPIRKVAPNEGSIDHHQPGATPHRVLITRTLQREFCKTLHSREGVYVGGGGLETHRVVVSWIGRVAIRGNLEVCREISHEPD